MHAPIVTPSEALALMKVSLLSDTPLLLDGKHGVGKSSLAVRAVKEMGYELVIRDLSLMEGPDLSGLPYFKDGRTHYAAPSFLPLDGKGLLWFEEVNRAPRHVIAPCFELLTSRRLNDYTLPPGWTVGFAINGAHHAEGYLVEELDPALLSRFMKLTIVPDVGEWKDWANAESLHAKVIEFVVNSPNIFDDPDANPRSWAYISKVIQSVEQAGDVDPEMLLRICHGFTSETWAMAFVRFYLASESPLSADEIIDGYPKNASRVIAWRNGNRLDLLKASWTNVQRRIQQQHVYVNLLKQPQQKKNVMQFLGDLPSEIRRTIKTSLVARGLLDLANVI